MVNDGKPADMWTSTVTGWPVAARKVAEGMEPSTAKFLRTDGRCGGEPAPDSTEE